MSVIWFSDKAKMCSIVSAICLVLPFLDSFLIPVASFNLESRLPIVKFGDKDSYFGYSVATHVVGEEDLPDNKKWLLVGAPLGQNYQPETNHSGALFKCPITERNDDCEQVITDGRRSLDSDDVEELQPPLKNDEIKDGQWLGVTVRSQGLGGKVLLVDRLLGPVIEDKVQTKQLLFLVECGSKSCISQLTWSPYLLDRAATGTLMPNVLVCAHRYITKIRDSQYGQGLCYVLSNELKYDEVYEPCKGRTVQRAHEDYGYCQVGTSGALLEDNTMVLGTPGPFTWRGTIFVTEIGGEYLERDKNMYYGDHTDNNSPVDKYSYLGMAVTGGRYFGEEMSYAAGAPRSNGHGQVVIFSKSNTNPIPVKKIIEGEQFASSFGYELTTADVNGDQEPDLLVAAPFYFSKNEGGAVYVYQNNNSNIPDTPTLKLTGSLESRFGLALANIGDINKDLCDDIAIGAPYEGNGVVYIYLGNRNGLSPKPSQVIRSSDLGIVPNQIKTFGSSLAGGTDLDGNSYPDLVIGAYSSSSVLALLARPIINIRTSVRDAELKNIDPNKQGCATDYTTNLTCFSFEACCAIDPYENTAPKDLKLFYTIEAETFSNIKKFSRVFFDRDNKRSNVIKRSITVKTNSIPACTRETAYVKEGTRDIQSPVKFRLNYTIVESQLPTSGLRFLNPILDQTEADKTFEAIFQKDCGADDVCLSKLEFNVEIDLDREGEDYTLVLGESDELRLNVNVTNSADSAYEAQIFIVHQPSVTYIAASKSNTVICNRFNETVVSCNLGNPMQRDSSAKISIRFNPSGLEDSESKLTFNIFANTTSQLKSVPVRKIDVRVIKTAEVSIHGWARPEQSFYGGEVKGESAMKYLEDIGSPVTHTYQIYNNGPWKAPRVTVTILWPHQVANDKKQGKWLLYLEDLPSIEGARQGECYVNPDYINPIKLPKRSKMMLSFPDIAPEPYILKSSNKSYTYTSSEKRSSLKTSASNNEVHLNRVRRDRAKIIRAERLTDKDGKKTDVVNMDCEKGTAFCIKISCDLYHMPQKTEAYIHVKARLWNSTLVGDYPRVDLVKIVSRGRIKIPVEFGVEQSTSDDKFAIETRAYPELLDQVRDSSTPVWVIVLAVLGGLLVLALLAGLMWKCGFFKRRRPDPTLSGNLEKNSENKPFIPK